MYKGKYPFLAAKKPKIIKARRINVHDCKAYILAYLQEQSFSIQSLIQTLFGKNENYIFTRC